MKEFDDEPGGHDSGEEREGNCHSGIRNDPMKPGVPAIPGLADGLWPVPFRVPVPVAELRWQTAQSAIHAYCRT